MENTLVGYRFSPTEEELINHYLKNKILDKPWLVNAPINEINICANDPKFLPSLSKLESNDVWYFFSRKEYYSSAKKKKGMKRRTPSGFWKATGKYRDVRKDNRRNGVVIGNKRSIVYYEGKSSRGVRTPWTMHEYEITCLPNVIERTYVICKIFYKGKVGDIPSYINSSEPRHSLVIDDSKTIGAANTLPQAGEESLSDFSVDDVTMIMEKQEDLCPWDALCPIPNTLFIDNNNNPNMQLRAPCLAQDDIELLAGLTHFNREHVEFMFIDDQEFITQENCEEYMQQRSCLF